MAKLDYYNLTHKGLSYSRQLTLHSCPRKYELDAKKAIKGRIESVTFSYGHAVGQAIQSTMAGRTFNETIIDTVLAYTHDEDDAGSESEQNAKKSIWWAVVAAEEFHKKYHAGVYSFLDGWEVAMFKDESGNDLPAVELTFVVTLIDGYSYEGHIDLVLYHPGKDRYMILELKTTGMSSISEASYKNSAQALGYGVVLDLIADNMKATASFDVLYMVYKSRTKEIIPMLFTKTPDMRVKWLSSLLTDMQILDMYEENGYPTHGESCYNFFRECEYLGLCTMSDESIDRMYGSVTAEDEEGGNTYSAMSTPTFLFTIDQLLERQETLVNYASSPGEDDVDLLLDVVQVRN
jgi:hypothetical protein